MSAAKSSSSSSMFTSFSSTSSSSAGSPLDSGSCPPDSNCFLVVTIVLFTFAGLVGLFLTLLLLFGVWFGLSQSWRVRRKRLQRTVEDRLEIERVKDVAQRLPHHWPYTDLGARFAFTFARCDVLPQNQMTRSLDLRLVFEPEYSVRGVGFSEPDQQQVMAEGSWSLDSQRIGRLLLDLTWPNHTITLYATTDLLPAQSQQNDWKGRWYLRPHQRPLMLSTAEAMEEGEVILTPLPHDTID